MSPFSCLLCPFDVPSSLWSSSFLSFPLLFLPSCLPPFLLSLSTCQLSGQPGTPGSCYMYFLSHPGTSYLSKEPWFLLLDNDISSRGLEAGCAHCPRGVIASQESQIAEQAKQTCEH